MFGFQRGTPYNAKLHERTTAYSNAAGLCRRDTGTNAEQMQERRRRLDYSQAGVAVCFPGWRWCCCGAQTDRPAPEALPGRHAWVQHPALHARVVLRNYTYLGNPKPFCDAPTAGRQGAGQVLFCRPTVSTPDALGRLSPPPDAERSRRHRCFVSVPPTETSGRISVAVNPDGFLSLHRMEPQLFKYVIS